MKAEAYLGASKPETVAVGEVTENLADLQYAVVRFSRDADPKSLGEFTGAYTHYGPAVSAVNAQTTRRSYGVLCLVRFPEVASDSDYGDSDPEGGSK